MPDYPLVKLEVFVNVISEGVSTRQLDTEATSIRFYRELDLWAWAWSTPQAVMWEREPWRQYSVALWVRTAVLCESSDAQAADKNSLHRFADQIGLTPAGLAGNGWAIAADELAGRRQEKTVDAEVAAKVPPKRRLRSVNGSG